MLLELEWVGTAKPESRIEVWIPIARIPIPVRIGIGMQPKLRIEVWNPKIGAIPTPAIPIPIAVVRVSLNGRTEMKPK